MKSSSTHFPPEILRAMHYMTGCSSSSDGNGTTNPKANLAHAPNGLISQADYECLVRSQEYGWMLD